MQEPQLWIAYFWSYGPLKLKIVDFAIWLYPLCNFKLLKISSWKFIQILNNIRRHAEYKNCNSGLAIFGVMAFEAEKSNFWLSAL